jgi:hypothetical protein
MIFLNYSLDPIIIFFYLPGTRSQFDPEPVMTLPCSKSTIVDARPGVAREV